MSAPVIGLVIALGFLGILAWLGCSAWAFDPFLDAWIDIRPEGWLTDAIGRVLIWIVATAVPIALVVLAVRGY